MVKTRSECSEDHDKIQTFKLMAFESLLMDYLIFFIVNLILLLYKFITDLKCVDKHFSYNFLRYNK